MNLLNTPQKARTKVKATTAVMCQKEHKGSHMTRPERAPPQVRAAPSVRVKPHLDGAPDQPVLELRVVRQRQARTPQPMVPRPRRPLMRKSTRSMKHFLDSWRPNTQLTVRSSACNSSASHGSRFSWTEYKRPPQRYTKSNARGSTITSAPRRSWNSPRKIGPTSLQFGA